MRLNAVTVQDDEDYESDEAEFVEAQTDFDVCETRMSTSTLEIDHIQDHEAVWQRAIELLIEELSSAQIKVAIVFLLLMVYSSHLSPLVFA